MGGGGVRGVSQAQGIAGTMALRWQNAGEGYALVKSPPFHVIATICIHIILQPTRCSHRHLTSKEDIHQNVSSGDMHNLNLSILGCLHFFLTFSPGQTRISCIIKTTTNGKSEV